MSDLRGGLVGCGYFAANHLHAWRQVRGGEIVALCDLDEARLAQRSAEFGIAAVYADLEQMLGEKKLDFVDIVTKPESHRALVEQVAAHRIPVICQKPMAPTLADAEAMVAGCAKADVTFMVHENFRWQRPMRALKAAADEIGELFFAQVSFRSAFDVYVNQPYLATDERFIIYDLGVHCLDLARFFMGNVDSIYCRTQRVNPQIKAEDVATMMMQHQSGAASVVDISYASILAEELFPQTLVRLEGSDGSAELGADFMLTVTQGGDVRRHQVPPAEHAWSEPPGTVVQDSVLMAQQHWVDTLRAGASPETCGSDNLRTMELVFGAYESAATGHPYRVRAPHDD